METSRAEMGSSHTINSGSEARARYADALALSAGELVGDAVAVAVAAAMPGQVD
jgi:hypothetical protein